MSGREATAHGRRVTALDLADMDAEDVVAFLDYLEHTRHNTVATRNVRLADLLGVVHDLSVSNPRSRVLARGESPGYCV